MDITKVPKIEGYTLPNSVAYGLSLSTNYSASPSKLLLNFVSTNGKYTLPNLNLNTTYTITFGNFKFQGKLWSYNLKENSQEKTLDIEFIDNSIILDQHYVILWKRGLLGNLGGKDTIRKTIDLSSERFLIPIKKAGAFPYTVFEERSLPNQTITRDSRQFYGSRGNIILLGKEDFPNSECDIPSTFYTFNDLKSELQKIVSFKNAPSNNTLKNTYEGSLRSVLGNWCGDFGLDYFWDYTNNSINFYNVGEGININLPKNESSKIISKETKSSMEGTFRQYSLAYSAKPKSSLRTIPFSNSYTISYDVPPLSLSYLMKKNGVLQEITAKRNVWGGPRSQEEFLASAFLGFVSRSLRDLYCLKNEFAEVLGYSTGNEYITGETKQQLISALMQNGLQDQINEFKKLDNENLSGYNFFFTYFDENLADKWFQVEQDMLQNLGKYYRIPDSSGSFFFCNENQTVEIEITVDPESSNQLISDPKDKTVRKVFARNGQMSHDNISALEELKYNDIADSLPQCFPYHLGLKENGIYDKLKDFFASSKKSVSHLVILPKFENFADKLIKLEISVSNGIHPTEQAWFDLRNSNSSSGRKNCAFEEKLRKGSCISAEEEAKTQALQQVNNSSQNRDDLVSGLSNKSAKFANIKLKSGKLKLYAPSDDEFKVVCKYSINVNRISNENNNELISFESNAPAQKLTDVAEIRLINENATNSEDEFSKSRKKFDLPDPVIALSKQQNVKYVFAGEPPSSINLNPSNGLTNLDISFSSEGFTTSATFSSRPPTQVKSDNILRFVNSQLNRASFNAS